MGVGEMEKFRKAVYVMIGAATVMVIVFALVVAFQSVTLDDSWSKKAIAKATIGDAVWLILLHAVLRGALSRK